MFAEIITIGDEILIGQIVDTNSAWMGQELNKIGIRVKQISSVSDDREHILNALAEAAKRVDIILITGGLGPTKDDITKKTLCEYFNVDLKQNSIALENVKRIFEKYNAPLLEVNIKQAELPVNCTPLQNTQGTAPGMWFEHQDKVYVSMPGVPFEMMNMMETEVLPRLKTRFKLPYVIHQTLLTAGIGESFLADKIAGIEDSLPSHIKLAYLPKLGQVRLRLSGSGDNEQVLKDEIAKYAHAIKSCIPEYLLAENDVQIQEAIINKLISEGKTLSLAESCTGGYMSHLMTSIPGSSKAFLGGAVSYSYELKEQMLGVKKITLEEFGAVSEQTVIEMAQGALKNYGSDYSIACSGIAGPDGGTEDKPVGTVWIAVASNKTVVTKLFKFSNKRMQNIERTAVNGLMMLFNLMNTSKTD